VKLSDLSIDERREAMKGRELQPRFYSDVNIYNNLVNDFTSGTSNVVLNNNAKMTEEPFEKKEDNFGGTQYNLDGTPMNTGRII
jgi:hypothetical protein